VQATLGFLQMFPLSASKPGQQGNFVLAYSFKVLQFLVVGAVGGRIWQVGSSAEHLCAGVEKSLHMQHTPLLTVVDVQFLYSDGK